MYYLEWNALVMYDINWKCFLQLEFPWVGESREVGHPNAEFLGDHKLSGFYQNRL